MSRKYSFSITTKDGEKLEVTGCDSFDEAIGIVERGARDREYQIQERIRQASEDAVDTAMGNKVDVCSECLQNPHKPTCSWAPKPPKVPEIAPVPQTTVPGIKVPETATTPQTTVPGGPVGLQAPAGGLESEIKK